MNAPRFLRNISWFHSKMPLNRVKTRKFAGFVAKSTDNACFLFDAVTDGAILHRPAIPAAPNSSEPFRLLPSPMGANAARRRGFRILYGIFGRFRAEMPQIRGNPQKQNLFHFRAKTAINAPIQSPFVRIRATSCPERLHIPRFSIAVRPM